jgi:hypothetical protein
VYRHQLFSKRKLRVWMIVNAVLLVAVSGWVLRPAFQSPPATDGFGASDSASQPGFSRTAPPLLTKQSVMAAKGVRFGISAPQVPWSSGEIERISAAAGARPTLLQYFVKWTVDVRPAAIEASYERGALPMISWEPWAGLQAGMDQPTYSLSKIANGSHDKYVTRFATAIRDQRRPVAIRFAHEMNGHWYPWSERRSGNIPGDFIRAWRHVHDVFRKVGATNVIWVWSPNIIRPVPRVSLRSLYPGDAYVDWVGLVGYAVNETTAGAVFDPTIAKLRKFTKRPLVITETGAKQGSGKPRWITDFFAWMSRHPDVIGFVWFEFSREEGGSADWRFAKDRATAAAFKAGLAKLLIAPSV